MKAADISMDMELQFIFSYFSYFPFFIKFLFSEKKNFPFIFRISFDSIIAFALIFIFKQKKKEKEFFLLKIYFLYDHDAFFFWTTKKVHFHVKITQWNWLSLWKKKKRIVNSYPLFFFFFGKR